MEVKKTVNTVRCDMSMCGRPAVYSVGRKDAPARKQLNLCPECALELYEELGKLFTPKSPANIVGRKSLKERSGE